jgi:hypothetical protein
VFPPPHDHRAALSPAPTQQAINTVVTLRAEDVVAYLGGGLVGAWEEDGDAHTLGAVCPLVVRAGTVDGRG